MLSWHTVATLNEECGTLLGLAVVKIFHCGSTAIRLLMGACKFPKSFEMKMKQDLRGNTDGQTGHRYTSQGLHECTA